MRRLDDEQPAGREACGDMGRRFTSCRCGFLRAAVRTRRSRTPPVDHTRALRPAIGRRHVTEPQMERREARVSPIARRRAPVSSRDGAGKPRRCAPRRSVAPHHEMREGTSFRRPRAVNNRGDDACLCLIGCLTIASGRNAQRSYCASSINPVRPRERGDPRLAPERMWQRVDSRFRGNERRRKPGSLPVMHGLGPRIHVLLPGCKARRGWPGHQGVYARLRRACPAMTTERAERT